MTDQEILEKYGETIENGMNKICQAEHIEDDSLKEAILHAYEEGFLEGFKNGWAEKAREIAKRLIVDGMPLEKVSKFSKLSMEIIEKLAAEVSAEQ